MSEQPSPQETQRNRRHKDQTPYPQQHNQAPRPAQQPRRYPQGQQGRPRYPQGNAQQNPQRRQAPYPQAPQQRGYPQRQAPPANQPYPPQGQVPYQPPPQRPMPAPSSGTSPLETVGKLVGGFFKVLAYPFVKLAQLIGRVLTIILEEMVRTVVSFIMGLVMLIVVGALIIGYVVALVSVDFNFVAAVPEMWRMFGGLVGMG